MAWRARTANETGVSGRLLADVVDLHTGTGTLQLLVLQMTYDPAQLLLTAGMTEDNLAKQGGIYSQFSVTTVPEPGTIILLVTGALALLAYAWRRRRAAM